jgi:WASH complex subunit strumpellin
MDQRIDGMVRERMLICTLRYIGQNELPNLDEVCKLCARTGYDRASGRRPNGYPENYFRRFTIPDRVVDMIIGRLRSDDIYSQIQAYPLPEHRSAALATQAAMLYVVLFFAPNTLQNESAVMREIVDKHFPDNWVIAWYLGFTVDLTLEWEPYRAAKTALNNTTTMENVSALKQRYVKKMQPILEALKNYLTEGVLIEEFILERRNKLMATLRECNVALRWLVLHTRRSTKKLNQMINEGIDQRLLLQLLGLTAQFEFVFRQQLKNVLDSKAQKWDDCKKESADRMRELGEYFSGEKPLTRVKKNEHLQRWFSTEIAAAIDTLDVNNETVSGRKMGQLIHALEEVEQYHDIETNLQVKQFLVDTRAFLRKMMRIVNIGEEVMATFDIVADVSYMWDIVNEYLPAMQDSIKRDPSSVLRLRSIFLKMSSILQIPCVRIGQAKSPDLVSVSQYYSGELIKFVRKVLEVVPKSVFVILKEIIDIQTNQMKELPTRLEKDTIKEFAQLQHRHKLSECTYKVSVFTRGVLAMERTFVGLKEINPNQLLEDGIRKELVEQIAIALHQLIQFNKHTIEEFEAVLNRLAGTLDGFKRSFVYIQDYVNIYGLKIWQEEFQRIVHFNVEQECNVFLKRKVHEWASTYQSEAIPIPKFPPTDQSVDFIGRLARELLHHTNPQRTTYLDKLSAWYDPSSGREVISLKTFALLLRSVNVWGLVGLDKLLAFMIVTDLKVLINTLGRALREQSMANLMNALTRKFAPLSQTPAGISKVYPQALKDTSKLIQQLPELLAKIGQKQLLRRQIANILSILLPILSSNTPFRTAAMIITFFVPFVESLNAP